MSNTTIKRPVVNPRDAALHQRVQDTLDLHQRTPSTCTCGHWVYFKYSEHLLTAVLAAFEESTHE